MSDMQIEIDKLEIEQEKISRAARRKRSVKRATTKYRLACAMNGLAQITLMVSAGDVDKFKQLARESRAAELAYRKGSGVVRKLEENE